MGSGTRPKRLSIAAAALAAICVIASACGGDDGGDAAPRGGSTPSGTAAPTKQGCPEPKPLPQTEKASIVSTVNIETFAPALLANHFGEFEKENLDITMVTAPSNEGTVMVANGQAQLKLAGITAAFLNAVNGGVNSVWIANMHQNPPDSKEGIWLRPEFFDASGKVIPDKLDGARIAPGTGGVGSISSFQISEFLAEHGRTMEDIEIVPIGGTDMLVAIENGAIDGGYVLTPQWLELDGGDSARYVGLYGQDAGADRAAMYEMSRTFIEQEPETAKALIRAIARTVCTYLQATTTTIPRCSLPWSS